MSRKGRYNAADEREVEERRQKEKLESDQAQADLEEIMSTTAGRRFMRRLIGQCGLYRSSFTGNSTTFFNEGARNVGLWVHAEMMSACPQRYLEMLQEGQQEESDG